MDFIITPILILLALLIWRAATYVLPTFSTLRNKRICLLIAHPDDEAMFFAPTLIALSKPELKNHIKILCFSTGNSENLGATRKKELTVSGLLLGLKSQSDITCLDHPSFPDSQSASWDPSLVAAELSTRLFTGPAAAQIPTADILLTFDRAGVSSHPNHAALHAGAHAFLRALPAAGAGAPIALYTLTSTSLPRKYASILDVPVTLLQWVLRRRSAAGISTSGKKKRSSSSSRSAEPPSTLVCVSGWAGYRRAQRAMVAAHVSQMRWFRWGWIGVSRYMVVNDLRREGVV